ncbi:uncharacterized protein TNCT_292071 [Trichonephila clavata]|uniref:Uncharacterized protein n=1 Tax=Trichonephila clavata TaxID=2740835 RepID=A0A8X6FRP2_TRICU|nr:uncharacterized protein TNCT_292071 [Trichonephila clavata]
MVSTIYNCFRFAEFSRNGLGQERFSIGDYKDETFRVAMWLKKQNQIFSSSEDEIGHFELKYTGFCPDMAHRIGQNYTDTTREVIRERPHLRGRLGSIRRHEAQNAGVTYRSGEGFECHYDAMPEYAQGYTGHVPTNLWTSCKREDQTYEDPRCPLKAYPLSCSEYGSSCADKRCDDEYSFCSRQSHGFGDNASIS